MLRGQAAIEYLIILAVVVIIALIVIGVIGGFPGMTRGVSEKASAAYWTSAEIGITRYSLSASVNKTQLIVRNNRLFSINLTNITFDGVGSLNYTNGVLLPPGLAISVNYSNVASCYAPGQPDPNNVVITYKDATYGTPYSFTGDVPLAGICQP